MKNIITIVGTSIFTNYQEKKRDLDDKIEDIEMKPYAKWKDWEEDIESIQNTINERLSDNFSAEIKSILKLKEKYANESLNIILLTTDTILSNLAAGIIKEYFKDRDGISVDEKSILVKDLQVEDYNKFKKGRDNLVKVIREIIKKEFDVASAPKKAFNNISENYIFNISGGYKIIIPTITIIAQIYQIKSFYIFENSDDLIENALVPLGFDDFLLEKLYFSIDMIKHQEDYRNIIDRNVIDKLRTTNFLDGKEVTQLGELFYDYVFYRTEISPDVLGYFVEYKLYEYFIEKGKYKDIKHSYRESSKRELDFVLDNETIVEVKPVKAFHCKEKYKKIEEQINGQLNDYPQYKKHHLYVYTSYKEVLAKHEEIRKNILEMYKNLKKNHSNVRYRCFEIYFSLRKKEDNQYQTFMKKPLKDKDIEEIKIGKEEKDV